MHDYGPLIGSDDADFEQVPGVVGTDEHDELIVEVFDPDWVVERMADRLVVDAVLSGTRCDKRLTRLPKLLRDQR